MERKKYLKLRGAITEKGLTQKQLAESVGMSITALNAKLNGIRQFTLEEAMNIAKFLEITNIAEIFFENTFPNTQQQEDKCKN